MIVLDASAAVSALLNEGPARRALAAEQVHVPHLIDSEIANALRRLWAARQLPEKAARHVLDTWRRLGVTRYPTVALLPRGWELRQNISAYDASYVALAEALECDLITADAKLAGAVGPRCSVTIVPR